MHTENTIFINGSPEHIFQLGANSQDWPKILPHYRQVKVVAGVPGGDTMVVDMHCVRSGFPLKGMNFPVGWRSVQVSDAETGTICFKHLAGIAQGMWVVWSLNPSPSGPGTIVTIAHDLTYPLAFLNGWFANELVGRDFVQAIAGRTLQTLKEIVENEVNL